MIKWIYVLFIAIFLYHVREVFPPFIVGAIIAYLLLPLVNGLANSAKVSMRVAVTVIYLLFLAVVAGIVYWFGQPIAEELNTLYTDRLEIVSNLINQVASQFGWQVDEAKATNDILRTIEQSVGKPEELVHIGGIVSRSMLAILVTIVSSIYFIVDSGRVGTFFMRFVPDERRHKALELIGQMNSMLSKYVRGQLTLVVLMAFFAYIFLHFVFHLHYALVIALVSGFLEIIPVLGPILATTTATVVGISQLGFGTAIWIIPCYTLARWAEDYFVIPNVIGHAVELHPLAVIFAVLCGEVTAGALGMLIAIPVAASVKVVLDVLYPPVPSGNFGSKPPGSGSATYDISGPVPYGSTETPSPHEEKLVATAEKHAAITEKPAGNVINSVISTAQKPEKVEAQPQKSEAQSQKTETQAHKTEAKLQKTDAQTQKDICMITLDTVRHIAKLARLNLSPAEETLYTEQLGKILQYFEELKAIDTTNIEPMSHALQVVNVMREDVVVPSPGHEAILANAPDKEKTSFRVPRIGE
jgi:aspartyl/glutamyl-tRNA(Asn/Gln) amidotransferase C subunit